MSGVRAITIAEFNKVFGEEPQPIEHYLGSIKRSTLLTVGSHFLGFNAHNKEHLNYRDFFDKFFSPENEAYKINLLAMFSALKRKVKGDLLIVNVESSLEFFQYVFENAKEEGPDFKVEDEISVLLAYLAFSQKTRSKESLIIPSVGKEPTALNLASIFFTQSYAYSNLVNYNESELIVSQLIKASFFFEFLSNTSRTAKLYNAFLSHYGFTHWKEYIFKLFPFVNGIIQNEKEGYINFLVREGQNYQSDCDFLDKLMLGEGVIEDYDYRKIRTSPLYKVEQGKYRIVFGLFLLEKIYKGLYFKLSELNENLGPDKVKALHSLIADEFSEQVLVYEILNSIYKKQYVTITGREFKTAGINAEPDFYIRKGNKIFLFESKDFLIRAEVKTSNDFQQLKKAFEKKLWKDGNENKAIAQLLNNCQRILDKQLPLDNKYDEKKVVIYPVILVHDNQYNVIGLNTIVNIWFQQALSELKDKGYEVSRIKPVVIVNIDTLIYHQDLFRERTLKLEEVLDEYVKSCSLARKINSSSIEQLKSTVMKRILPLSNYLEGTEIVKKKHRVPKMLKERIGVLFSE